jgi:alkylhydroperoxidase/carboxymuconolactone decarboxylase family protein YurZ
MSATESEDQLAQQRLEAVRAKRGYLLPHHGLLAVAAPKLLEGYDAAYTALTLDKRHLSERDKEFIWLAVLISCDEGIATHHIKKFRDAGGTDDQLETALRLSALADGARRYAFVDNHWKALLPNYDREEAYRAALSKVIEGRNLPQGLIEIALCAVYTATKQWWELAVHLRGAYREKVPEVEIAEAISYAMFPGSIPNFVDACGVWQKLIADDEVEASPAFKLWGKATDQNGFAP